MIRSNSDSEADPPSLPPRRGRDRLQRLQSEPGGVEIKRTQNPEDVQLPVKKEKDNNTSYLEQVKIRCKMGFGKVHSELLSIVKQGLKRFPSMSYEDNKIRPKTTKPISNPIPPKKQNEKVYGVHRCVNRPLPEPPPLNPEVSGRPVSTPYIDMSGIKKTFDNCDHLLKPQRRQDVDSGVYEEVEATVYEPACENVASAAIIYDDPDENNRNPTNKLKHKSIVKQPRVSVYETPDISHTHTLEDNHQGEKPREFFGYSVKELVRCLTTCGLEKVAKICEEEHLDGEFFKSVVVLDLRDTPFELNDFQITKLNRAIEGWRPLER